MGRFNNSDRWLGLFFVILSLIVMLVWVPLDTSTGLVETVRRRWVIGDALGPTVAGCFLLVGGVLAMLFPGQEDGLQRRNLVWMLILFGTFFVALVLMRYAGPIVTNALTEEGYRPLRATIPWKYIGYLIGGTVLVGGLTSFARGRILWTDWAIALVATVVIALAYDLPFDDLLLPPNGDV